jgi:ribosomal protein S18 acetylase RimI-like enzyme
MPENIQIRRLGVTEADAYREIRLAALAGAPEAFSSRYEVEAAQPIESFAEQLASSIVCVACVDGEIVGLGSLAPAPVDRDPTGSFVSGVYVRPETRGRGVARRLMDALLSAGADVFDEVRLDVFAENLGALALYERLAFSRIASSLRMAPDGRGQREALTMVRRLAPTPGDRR